MFLFILFCVHVCSAVDLTMFLRRRCPSLRRSYLTTVTVASLSLSDSITTASLTHATTLAASNLLFQLLIFMHPGWWCEICLSHVDLAPSVLRGRKNRTSPFPYKPTKSGFSCLFCVIVSLWLLMYVIGFDALDLVYSVPAKWCQDDPNGSPSRELEETTRVSPYHVTEHRPTRS